ncbi:MAG: cytochrome c1 [Alphaproteobacteria bacterium]|nr:cytochrome c1 [Alphaproteobacteria bacterium]
MRGSLTLVLTLTCGLMAGLSLLAAPAAAAEMPEIESRSWSFDGIFGHFDRAAQQRGYQVYNEVCSGCHGLRLLTYRNLAALGYGEDDIKAFAAEYEVTDGPDDEGEMYQREALPSDHFVSPFANTQAARAANNGALPPDLSLMVKARKNGANYLYALLTGYGDAPDGGELPDGLYYNAAFPGHQIAMSAPLDDDAVEYTDGTPATVDQMASDVTTFLAWAASPEMEERKRLGLKVMLFLLVLTALLAAVKRKVWSRLH